MNRYQEIEIDGRKLLAVEVESLIRKGEDTLGIDHANIDAMNAEQLARYLIDLRCKYKKHVENDKLALQEPTNETMPPIKAAPVIQETDQREKELDALIDQLRAVNRSHKVEWARGKKVPIKALLHAASLWLSDDPDDWTAANDTLFQFTSPFGNKQLCYRRSENVAIPQIGGRLKLFCRKEQN